MLRRILLPIGEIETTQAATEVSIQLAHEFRGSVTCLATMQLTPATAASVSAGFGAAYYDYPTIHQWENRLRSAAEGRLHRTSEHIVESGEHTETRIGEGQPWSCIEEESLTHDLIIVNRDAHFEGHGEDVPLRPGRTLKKLLDHSACPVMIVSQAPLKAERVLVGIDGRVGSARALQQFLQSEVLQKAHVILFWSDEYSDGPQPDLDSYKRYVTAHGRDCETLQTSGMARKKLLEVADQRDVDLVVVGAHGKPRFIEWILGSSTRDFLMESRRALWVSS